MVAQDEIVKIEIPPSQKAASKLMTKPGRDSFRSFAFVSECGNRFCVSVRVGGYGLGDCGV